MLTNTVATLTQQAITDKATISKLQQQLHHQGHSQGHPPPNGVPAPTFRGREWKDQGSYCWSHGYKVGRRHGSQTCTNRKEGHQEAATRTDLMGGSTWGQEDIKK